MKSLLLATRAALGVALPLSAHAEAAAEAAPTTVDRLVVTGVRSALTVPDTAQATAAIERVPGAVEVIPDTAFKAGWTAYLEGRNLTDERYISSVAIAGVAALNAEIFNPGVGRAVYAGLRYDW